MRPTMAAGSSRASREFSVYALRELLRALRARAGDHPENPGLIASWPGVPEARMAAACGELRRQGHALREISIARPGHKDRSGWAMGGTTYRAVVTPPPPPALGHHDAVLVREVAVPKAVSVARATLTRFAEREGAAETVRSA